MVKYKYVINCDGGARGNPGPAASAFVVTRNGRVVFKENKFLGIKTNNYAEYYSVIMAAEWIETNLNKERGVTVVIILDSLLVTSQLKGKYKVKSPTLKVLYTKTKRMLSNVKVDVDYLHVSREDNKMADELVNTSLDENG